MGNATQTRAGSSEGVESDGEREAITHDRCNSEQQEKGPMALGTM